MNTRLGKSFGLAFVVAVGILALMFALGTFNAQKAGAQAVTAGSVEVDPSDPAPGAAIEVSVDFQNKAKLENFASLEIELEGFGIPDSIDARDVQIRIYDTEGRLKVAVKDKADKPIDGSGLPAGVTVDGDVITLEIKKHDENGTIDIGEDAYTTITFRKRAGITAPAQAGKYDVRVGDDTAEDAVTISPALSIDPGKGGGSTEITVSGKAFADGTGSLWAEPWVEITDTIFEGGAGQFPGEDKSNGWGLSTDANAADKEYDLLLVKGEVATDSEPAVTAHYVAVEIDVKNKNNPVPLAYVITLAPGPEPTEDTPIIPPGSYDSANAELLKDVTVDDGAFSTTVLASDLMTGDDEGMSSIRMNDADNDTDRAVFQVTGTVTLGGDSVGKGRILKISLSDWIDPVPDEVRIGGIVVANGDDISFMDKDGKNIDPPNESDLADGEHDIYVKVLADVRLGTKTVVLFDSGGERLNSASVEITASDLAVNPSTAVVGREVTITGTGFTGTVVSIMVGDAPVCEGAGDDKCDIDVASGGRVVAAFDVPDKAVLSDAGDYAITLTDSGGRIGSGMVTIPEPTITVDPLEGRIGTTVNLSGTGWPTGTGANLVAILYGDDQYTTAISSSDGRWSASLTVPVTADVGTTNTIAAKATVGGGNTANVTQEVDHKTPDPIVTLSSAQAQRGTTITVSGDNFHVFETVTIEIGDSTVTPSPAPTTDGTGSFTAEVLVPGLALGNKNLKVTVNKVPVVEFLEVVTTPVSTTMASADVFAELVTADNLIVVWHFDNTTKDWSFYDPRPAVAAAVDLKMVSTGDNVWVQITADQTFQGEALTAGWNLVTLD